MTVEEKPDWVPDDLTEKEMGVFSCMATDCPECVHWTYDVDYMFCDKHFWQAFRGEFPIVPDYAGQMSPWETEEYTDENGRTLTRLVPGRISGLAHRLRRSLPSEKDVRILLCRKVKAMSWTSFIGPDPERATVEQRRKKSAITLLPRQSSEE
ncbi:hypothetical protein [Bifidobacterium psychraerophilum]|uniref:hypothetical protein n=1 Tax=Bifidobacterium psychraerophilum TaxID=218140 RepID=UPI0039E88A34